MLNMMSRRTNLNTVRRSFIWDSNWMVNDPVIYNNLLILDYKINDYLIGIFYSLKIASSNYVISRFFDNIVLIESDIYFFDTSRLYYFNTFRYYFSYFIYRFKRIMYKHLYKIRRRNNKTYLYSVTNNILSATKNNCFFISHFNIIKNKKWYLKQNIWYFLSRSLYLFRRMRRSISYKINTYRLAQKLVYIAHLYFIRITWSDA